MNATFEPKILTVAEARAERDRLHAEGKKLVFTNGCFDILHRGHVTYMSFARSLGDALCVGLNSDASVRRNKGPNRPINSEEDRAYVLGSLRAVDCVVFFDEDEPRDIIAKILPHILVKSRDWAHYVSGREVVEASGGKVVLADMVGGRSTTGTIERVLEVYGARGKINVKAADAAAKKEECL
ncbi:MAG: adenylyltransferase/cytidyltransferase family protein [Opitutaceae bacterium]|jgi:rfaE bifunctional protein nucleotidyltransferase chain/domain|nr:adenylyltransferase/cytidyltransferase family protein [Opitutaceae bacterium]